MIPLDVTLPLEPLWSSTLGFIVIVLVCILLIGMGSRSLTIGSLGAYTTFVYIATQTDISIMTDIMYVSLVLVLAGLGFKLVLLEAWGE